MTAPIVTPLEVSLAIADEGRATYVDVRTVAEFVAGHPRGRAVNVPIEFHHPKTGASHANASFVLVMTHHFALDAPLVVGADEGPRASAAAAALLAAGYVDVRLMSAPHKARLPHARPLPRAASRAGSNIPVLQWLLVALGGFVCLFACWFFRNPKRTVPQEALADDAVVIAPADGKVVQIITLDEPRLIKGKAQRISIFLSPLDVHVNRVPANGEIVFSDYQPGKFLVAMDHRASEENEQTIIGLRNSKGSLLFKQMTGALARRIVNEAKPGDHFKAGDEFGMMKFGSRMDVLVPEGSQILVREGERVVGGETLLCRLM